MNVGELITALNEFPSDMDVMIPDDSGDSNFVFLGSIVRSRVEFEDDNDEHPEDFEAICLVSI